MRDLSDRIRARVAETPFTQDALAAAIGLSRSSLSKRLNGHTHWSASELYRLADALGCSVLDFDREENAHA